MFVSRLLGRMAQLVPGGASLRPGLHRFRGARIGRHVWISQYVYLDEIHPEAIHIGDNSTIGLRTSIIAHLYWGPHRASDEAVKQVVIESHVFVGPHCLILPGSRIGEGSVIKGGSVVTGNIPPRTFWGAPPCGPLAQVTVPLSSDFSYEEFLAGLKPFPKLNGSTRPAPRFDLAGG